MGNKILFLLVLFCGCQNAPNIFSKHIKEYRVNQPAKLVCDKTYDTPMGTYNFFSIDSFFIYQTRDKDALFQVWSVNNIYINKFGTRGKGSNEFINTIYMNRYVYNSEKELCFWVNDMMKNKLQLINLTRSIKNGQTFIQQTLSSPIQSPEIFILSDSILLIHEFTHNSVNNVFYNTVKNSIRKEQLYPSIQQDPYTFYLGSNIYNPNLQKIAMAMLRFNQIHIQSLEPDKRIAITCGLPEKNTTSFSALKQEERIYYSSLSATNSFIYVLYLNQLLDDETSQPTQIHIFNWQGNFLGALECSEYFDLFIVNEKGDYLYGLSKQNEKVYRYRLPQINS